MKQFVPLQVHSYPHLVLLDHMIEAVVRQHNELSQLHVLAIAHIVATKPHWALLQEYNSGLTANKDLSDIASFCKRYFATQEHGDNLLMKC